MRKIILILSTIVLCLFAVIESQAQFATYRKGETKIDIDLGSGKINNSNIEKIQILNSAGILSQVDKASGLVR
ncbi:MAG TPA: hypothetical protein PKY59_15745, partial [Pyrinomonadaceae bacterium]|nr:hypothetical protein [Pyrinomonadaceae bacterium]